MSDVGSPIDRRWAVWFLAVLAPGAESFTFQTFTDCPATRKQNRRGDPLARILHGSLDQHWDALVELSRRVAGIYVCINETDLKGRTAANIVRVRAYFADLDGADLSNLRRFGLRPHIVIQTSVGRYHAYWLIADAPLDRFQDTQRRLISLMDSDRKVKDLPRVMRLPGFPHQKDPAHPFLVTGATGQSGAPYSDADFQAALADAEKNHAHLTKPPREKLAERALKLLPQGPPDMRQGYPDGHRTCELTRRAGWCLGPWNMSKADATAACLDWNQHNTPPLGEEKVRSTVASIAKADAKKRQRMNGQQNTDPADKNGREPTQREKLISIGLDADLWHDKDGNSFASVTIDGHQESYAINGRSFRNWLTRKYGERYPIRIGDKNCPSAPGSQAQTEAINSLAAKAASGAENQPAVRVGQHAGSIYLDLGTPDWSAVAISSDGWDIVASPPVRFIRPMGLRALPVPVKGGNIKELAQFLNVATADDFIMVVSYLMATLRPTGPYPVLIVNGEQGSGKSIACRVLRRLIDPNAAELRTDTRDERDLLLAAKNGWIVALDNLSYVRNDLSDAICRIATKGAFATRALYTNDEEFLLEVCRPLLLNGIPPLASRADLADRAIVWVLPTMPEGRRRPEEEFWGDFDKAAPRILGALLDGVSGALRDYRSVALKNSYRMMDFAKWAEAGCRALGCPPGTFERAYARSRLSATDDALDADPVAGAVIEFMSDKDEFEGTATELLNTLMLCVSVPQRDRRWPKDATRLSGHLRRLPPLLRPRGIEIDFGDRTPDAARKRLIKIKRTGPK
jgi:hypothetical protein